MGLDLFCWFLPLKTGVIVSVVLATCIFFLQNGRQFSMTETYHNFNYFEQLQFATPIFFLLSALVGMFLDMILGESKRYMIPALLSLGFAIFLILWGVYFYRPVHYYSNVYPLILVIPLSYFWVTIYSYME